MHEVVVGHFRTANIGNYWSSGLRRVQKARRRCRNRMKKDVRDQVCQVQENLRNHEQATKDMEKEHTQELTRLLQKYEAQKAKLEEEAQERRRELASQRVFAFYA